MTKNTHLIFISPLWTPELEDLLFLTKESFDVKVMTEKQTIEFEDPYIEILQCLESYSPLEVAKITPWLIQLSKPHFHLILPVGATPQQLAGVGLILSLAKAIPESLLTHSPWSDRNWSFNLWLKAFRNLFDQTLSLPGHRNLKLSRSPTSSISPDTHPSPSHPDLISPLWIFPSKWGLELEWRHLIRVLLQHKSNRLEFWNWNHLPIRKQNKIRSQFSHFWNQFRSHPPRLKLEDWRHPQFLVLIGKHECSFTERELLDLALTHQVNLVMDSDFRAKLSGPWKDGDTFWLWHPSFAEHDNRPWSDPYLRLPFLSLSKLRDYRDQMLNQILRSFIRARFSASDSLR